MRILLPLLLLIAGPFIQAQVTLDAKSSVDDVLKALQARGQSLKDFTADVEQSIMDPLTLHETIKKGKVYFQRFADGDARIRVNFTRKKAGRSPEGNWHREYLLAKGVLIDQDFDASPKLETHHQVSKPGQKVDPLKLGQGAFPLPIGQEPADVKKNFDVKIVPAASDDPKGTIHAQLVPKPGTSFSRKYDAIEVWVDLQSQFTRRIKVIGLQDVEETTTDLVNLKINSGLTDADFQLVTPGTDWAINQDALQD